MPVWKKSSSESGFLPERYAHEHRVYHRRVVGENEQRCFLDRIYKINKIFRGRAFAKASACKLGGSPSS